MPRNPNFLHPSEQDLLNFFADNVLTALNCMHLGTISSFDSSTQTANATIDYQKVNYVYNTLTGLYDQFLSPYPPLVSCPVRFDMGQDGGFTRPVKEGDKCKILFNDRDMDGWFLGALNQPPQSGRLHAFCDAVIVPMTNPSNPIKNFDSSRPMVRDGLGTSYVAVNPANGKIQIRNPNGNLATIIQSLVSVLEGLTVNTGTGVPNPPYVTDLANIATQLGEVLE